MADIIRFYEGDESRVVIEKYDNFSSSVFRDQYERALKILKDFEDEKDDLTVPNIIAFCGDRGEGKTSCMLSLRHYLEDNEGQNHKYSVLDTIDPSFFDEKHNVLELVLGQLYSNSILSSVHHGDSDELYDHFNVVRNCVRTITEESKNIYDAIEDLEELGNGMMLKNSISKLVNTYLDYVKRKILIIVIDDMDYNWKGAYEMTQFVSKYLCQKNCILLISVSINQMVDVVRTSFRNQLNNAGTDEFYDVACKYVEKLIPLQHRIDMPHVYDICENKVEIYSKDGIKDEDVLPIKDTVVQYIFRKTRYLFYNYRDGVSQIVPKNLRMLRQLLGILVEMENYDKSSLDEKVKRRNIQNKLVFQSYFFTNWIRCLTRKNQSFVKTLMDSQDLSQKNKMVVMFMKEKLPESMDKSLKSIVKSDNYSYNISLGDVFMILDFIERNPVEDNDQLLVFFLKSYYSMLLYHYYDDITVSANSLHPQEEGGDDIFRLDFWFKGTNKLQRFVNGAYFQYIPGEILKVRMPQIGDKKGDVFVNFDIICLYGEKLNELLGQTRNVMNKPDANLTDEDKAYVIFVEILAMMMSWGDTQEISSEMEKRRNTPSPYHLVDFNGQMQNLVLDILAPFANILNPKFAYDRFKKVLPDLFDYTYDRNWSLLCQMMREAKGDALKEKQELNLASDAIIRNAEVLTSVKEKILSNAMIGNSLNQVNQLIADFYNHITDTEMYTYPLSHEEKGYPIRFSFIRVISSNLRKINPESFKNIVVDYHVERFKEGGTQKSIIVRNGQSEGSSENVVY